MKTRKLSLESLDSRILPAASISNGVLTITGEIANYGPLAGDFTQVISANSLGAYVVQNGRPVVLQGKVEKIVYEGTHKNDRFLNYTQVSDVIFGGAGDDLLSSGTGATSEIHGGPGRDRLVGRARMNHLYTDGNDVILASVFVLHKDEYIP